MIYTIFLFGIIAVVTLMFFGIVNLKPAARWTTGDKLPQKRKATRLDIYGKDKKLIKSKRHRA